MGISAGIEKFYTFAQFLSVLFLSVGFLATLLTTVYIVSRAPAGSGARRVIWLAAGFLFFLFTEIAIAVAPTHSAVRAAVALNCVAVFGIARLFAVFCGLQFSAGARPALPRLLVVVVVEAIVLASLAALRSGSFVFFEDINLDRVLPGTLFYALVSLSAAWVLGGILLIGVTIPQATCRQAKARAWFLSGASILLVTFLIHHLLPGSRVFPVLPTGVLVAVVLISLSLTQFNLLDVLLRPLEEVAARVDMLVVVFGESGSVVSANNERYGNLEIGGKRTAAELLVYLCAGTENPDERTALEETARLLAPSTGRISVAGCGEVRCFEYQTTPVTYMRRRVGWLLTLLDITEEEASIRDLHARELELEKGYEELCMYAKTELYHDAEKERESLIRELDATVDQGYSSLTRHLDLLISNPASDGDIEASIAAARLSLAEVRRIVRILQRSGRREAS